MGARELQALLREIKNVRSPIQRMKLISLAWRTVQRLSPVERKELGSKLGVRGFDAILAKLGRGPSGISPTEVLRALNSAEELDPSKLDDFMDGLGDPERRDELLRRGFDSLEERANVPEPPPVTELLEEEHQEPLEPEPKEQLEAAAEIVEVAEAEPSPVEIEAPLPPEPAVPKPEPISPPSSLLEAEVPEPRPRIQTDVVAAVAAAPGTTARFRSLRRLLDDAEHLDTDGIRTLLGSFPDGWSRRRALVSILRRGHPRDLDDALSLIGEIERATDRRWCVAALIDTRELDAQEQRQIFERFPFPSLARRVCRRAAKFPA